MQNRGTSKTADGADRRDEELAAAAGRANLRVDVAKQNVRLAKDELKRARKRYKEAKREAKRARKRASAARKAWKQMRRKQGHLPGTSGQTGKPAAAPARGRTARTGRRKTAAARTLSAPSASPRRG